MRIKMFGLGVCVAILAMADTAAAWGVWGHYKISRGAIYALPKEMGMFFYNHADYIMEESVAPDIRKYTMGDHDEYPRHFIRLERYNYTIPQNMPVSQDAAEKKYGKDTVMEYGTLPWTIQEVMGKLTIAMKEKNRAEILFLAANLGHYIADAHVPLHTTLNTDGQLTGQTGLHALWESQIPEQLGKNYSLYATSHYIKNINSEVWNIIDSSYRMKNTVLRVDKKLRTDKPTDWTFKIAANGLPETNRYGQKTHSEQYAKIYHELLGGMVELQLRGAIEELSSFWYTAWVNAGKPDLTSLDPDYVTERNQKSYTDDIKYWKKGKVTGYKIIKSY